MRVLYISLFCIFHSLVFSQNIVHLCEGDTLEDFAVSLTSGSTYAWSINGDTDIATIVSGNGTEHVKIDLNNSGFFWLVVAETDINSCIGYDSLLVYVHPIPSPNIYSLGDTNICEGDSVILVLDSVYNTMLWNNGSLGNSIVIDTSGLYFVTVIDMYGCSNISKSINVDVHFNPDVDFLIEGLCFQSYTKFIDISNIVSDSILFSVWTIDDSVFIGDSVVHYLFDDANVFSSKLKVVSSYNCSDSLIKDLEIFHLPNAEFDFSPDIASIISPEVQFINLTHNISSVYWDFDDSLFSIIDNPLHVFQDPGLYNVTMTVTDTNSCIDSTSHYVLIDYELVLYIPNSFTPDGDGNNDIFVPKGFRMDKFESYRFAIYNRWGELIFTTDKIDVGWGGFSKNYDECPMGLYTWSLHVVDENGANHNKIGTVRLFR